MSTVDVNNEIPSDTLFPGGSVALSEDLFGETAWLIIEKSLIQAEQLGHAQIGLSALLLSMIDQPSEGDNAEAVQELTAKLKEVVGAEETPRKPLELSRNFLTEDVQRVLVTAFEFAENDADHRSNRSIFGRRFWRRRRIS